VFGPGPPPQWSMPGTMNSRANSCVLASAFCPPPFFFTVAVTIS